MGGPIWFSGWEDSIYNSQVWDSRCLACCKSPRMGLLMLISGLPSVLAQNLLEETKSVWFLLMVPSHSQEGVEGGFEPRTVCGPGLTLASLKSAAYFGPRWI